MELENLSSGLLGKVASVSRRLGLLGPLLPTQVALSTLPVSQVASGIASIQDGVHGTLTPGTLEEITKISQGLTMLGVMPLSMLTINSTAMNFYTACRDIKRVVNSFDKGDVGGLVSLALAPRQIRYIGTHLLNGMRDMLPLPKALWVDVVNGLRFPG